MLSSFQATRGIGSTENFFKSLLGVARLNDLEAQCQDPRAPEDDGDGDPDRMDWTSRTIIYKVSYMWSLTTIHPTWTCTVDGL